MTASEEPVNEPYSTVSDREGFVLDKTLEPDVGTDWTPRQREVLAAALALLVEGGERALTTDAVARAANCSKESLYKWFGDREGLLSAVIEFQANKVRTVAPTDPRPDEATFRHHLQIFAIDLMDVLSSDVSLALNRLAIGQASRHGSGLGQLVLDRGRRTIELRAVALLELGHKAGHIAVVVPADAYATLYGLIVRDSHIRMLLGAPAPTRAAREAAARTAVDQFFRLYGAARKETARP